MEIDAGFLQTRIARSALFPTSVALVVRKWGDTLNCLAVQKDHWNLSWGTIHVAAVVRSITAIIIKIWWGNCVVARKQEASPALLYSVCTGLRDSKLYIPRTPSPPLPGLRSSSTSLTESPISVVCNLFTLDKIVNTHTIAKSLVWITPIRTYAMFWTRSNCSMWQSHIHILP